MRHNLGQTRRKTRPKIDYVVTLCHSVRERTDKAFTGATMLDLGVIVLLAIAGFLWALCAYTVGHKEGERIGFERGRAAGRHMSAKSVSQ